MTTPIIQSLIPIKESQKEKNILFLISSIWGGGAERVACRLVSEFSKRHKVYLMYFNEKNNNYFIDPKVKLIPFILTKGIQNKDKKISLKDLRMMEIEKVRRIYKIDITISFLYC